MRSSAGPSPRRVAISLGGAASTTASSACTARRDAHRAASCGSESASTLAADPRAVEFVAEAFRHCKSIGATGAATALLVAAGVMADPQDSVDGLYVTPDDRAALVGAALVEHGATRHWSRERLLK